MSVAIKEIRIDKNRKIVFEDLFVTLYREDALSIENKTHRLDYSFIRCAKFIPQRINWPLSFIFITLAILLQAVGGNPMFGEPQKIKIVYSNGGSREIDIDGIDKKLIKEILKEFRKRLKSKIAAQNA